MMKALLLGITLVFVVVNTVQAEKPWTRTAAFRASTDQIVLHYGEGMELVGIVAEGLTERGYPAIAVPG